ncbi:MFS transporter [Streptomyces sp. NA02950]|uniref:MFS transporter n=1 Tax=Streptomyces sp. NA02950 TaxID=2742137 RepID=UPI001591508E|nr:MFS transporter [Streptomyces sp. NA02950]QKV93126.1 MFS transporter [Streptomyces sp. NA02950]
MTTVDPTRAEKGGSSEESTATRIRVPAQRWPAEPEGPAEAGGGGGGPVRSGPFGRVWRALRHPVPAALALAAVLHLLWVALLANSGGDLAAQDAWAEFALQHPDSAYNLAWYGGMHPVSYSVISPYLMAVLGVRSTMMIAGTLSAGLLALLLVRSRAVRRPLWPALYGAFALTCNAISGRVTFGLGAMFGLAAVAVIFAWPAKWRSRRWHHRTGRFLLAAALSALSTMSSPVAGLFVGIVAAALWLTRRRPAAYALGVTPVIVVGLSAWLFPFSGEQPMGIGSVILPFITGATVCLCAPKAWTTVRVGAGAYALGAVLTWLIPSQIGTNISRLGMIFGGVALIAVLPALRTPPRAELHSTDAGRRWTALVLALATVTVWQVVKTGDDVIHTTPSASWARELAPLVDTLKREKADRGRVEVVPVRSHRESSALAPYVNLARGWNRQRDLDRNPLFYDHTLNAATYHEWLRRWAVHYVVLPADDPDTAAEEEAELLATGLPYLREVWSDANWKLYEVKDPTQIADAPATVERAGAEQLVLKVRSGGPVLIRVPYSPWLGLVDEDGHSVRAPKAENDDELPVNREGCLTKQVQGGEEGQPEDEWTVLHAPRAGTYRIAGKYQLPRGTPCPDEMAP